MKQLKYILLIVIMAIYACKENGGNTDEKHSMNNDTAQEIVDKSIAAHGGVSYNSLDFHFNFRGRKYSIYKDEGLFQYKRSYKDTLDNQIEDVLENHAFSRFINGEEINLSDKDIKRYSNSINSVIYFMLLPYPLNDAAVIKKYKGTTKLKGKDYHLIELRFQEEGGGVDFEDVFLYWFDTRSYFMDYLAYEFHVNNGGVRFRKAINQRLMNGIRIQDYINFKPKDRNTPLDSLQVLFENDELVKLSEILNTDIVFNK